MQEREQNIKVMGIIVKLDVDLSFSANSSPKEIRKVLSELDAQSNSFQPTSPMLCYVVKRNYQSQRALF